MVNGTVITSKIVSSVKLQAENLMALAELDNKFAARRAEIDEQYVKDVDQAWLDYCTAVDQLTLPEGTTTEGRHWGRFR